MSREVLVLVKSVIENCFEPFAVLGTLFRSLFFPRLSVELHAPFCACDYFFFKRYLYCLLINTEG
jgi:hypothetical protein